MDNTLSPLQRAFNAFLLSMPPQQLEDLLKYLQDARTQEHGQSLFRNENSGDHSNAISDSNHVCPVLPSSNPRSSASRGKKSQDGKRRPLNSFIAFRSFYSVIFPDLTQKAKSGILRFLWQNDPFKAKWTILAKAYSIIRDDHDNGVSLESFLALNAKLIGVLEPGRYLDAMGWELTDNGQQQYTMARIKTPVATEAELSTNFSVNDIIKNCYNSGYVSENKRKKGSKNDSAPVMAFATQPTLVIHKNNSLQITGTHTVMSNDVNANITMEAPSPEITEPTDSPYSGNMSPVINNVPFEVTDVPRMYQRPQAQDPQVENYLDLGNMQLSNWDEQIALLPYNSAPMMQDSLETFDFNPFLNL